MWEFLTGYKTNLNQTSHQGITSEKRTKALIPKCPLFRGFTVLVVNVICYQATNLANLFRLAFLTLIAFSIIVHLNALQYLKLLIDLKKKFIMPLKKNTHTHTQNTQNIKMSSKKKFPFSVHEQF